MKTFDQFGRLLTTDPGFEHVQSVPEREWLVNHDLDYRPAAVSIWINNKQAYASVEHITDSKLRIKFNSAVTGRVEVK